MDKQLIKILIEFYREEKNKNILFTEIIVELIQLRRFIEEGSLNKKELIGHLNFIIKKMESI